MNEIGTRIRQARQSARRTLRELARAIGVSHEAVRKYEEGLLRPSPQRLADIARALGYPPDYFETLDTYRHDRARGV